MYQMSQRPTIYIDKLNNSVIKKKDLYESSNID